MNGFLRDIAILPKSSFPALALLAALGLSLAGPAEAADCPSGQIYRVSKKACMDRAEAVKLGIIRPAPGKAAAAPAATEAAPESAAEPEAARDPEPLSRPPAPKRLRAKKPDIQQSEAPAPDAVAAAPAAPPPVATAPAAPSRPVIVRTVPVAPGATPQPPGGTMTPSASPFGALNVENFAKP